MESGGRERADTTGGGDATGPARCGWTHAAQVTFPAPAAVVAGLRERLADVGLLPGHVHRVEVRYLDCTDLPGVLDAVDTALGRRRLPVQARQVAWLSGGARVEVNAIHAPIPDGTLGRGASAPRNAPGPDA